jgi:hypothetical protein
LKLADRIANVEHSLASGRTDLFKMYLKEMPDFEHALRAVSPRVEPMWIHLKKLLMP